MGTHKDPTPKQQEVLDKLATMTVPQVAKAMGITSNSVYNHIRKLRAKGIDVPLRESLTAAPQPTPQLNTNGATIGVEDPEANLRSWIEQMDHSIAGMNEDISTRRNEIHELESRVTEALATRDRYDNALAALTG